MRKLLIPSFVLLIGMGLGPIFYVILTATNAHTEGQYTETNSALVPAIKPADLGGNVTLAINETGQFDRLQLTFLNLIADYRCPINTDCKEEGSVAARVILTAGADSLTRSVSSAELPFLFSGYEISITDVSPQPAADTVISKNDYQVSFHITPKI
jgi:hypothetical protein